jgi:predicted unusual protein kinase regulating ubiquinone biosynthesis (AarF/ABC1/UbiB family)
VDELRRRLRDELDYRQELRHQQIFGEIWQGHPLIRIPRVYPEHSSQRVLCQQHCRGLGYYEFLRRSTQKERDLAVFVLNDFVWDSMHRFHVFNGDPHPGNYLFAPDGGVTFVDFGCVKRFEPAFIGRIQALNRAIVEEDRPRFDALVREMRVVLPGRSYDADFIWQFFAYHAAPFSRDRVFTFDRAFIERAAEVMAPANLKRLNLPPELLLFNRITFGLNAIFAELGASANFHRLYRRYLYPDETLPPALAVAGAVLAPRFTAVAPHPVEAARLGADAGPTSPGGEAEVISA